MKMGWDSEFFIPKSNVSETENGADGKVHEDKKPLNCASCNQVIGVVSTTIYEIGEKHYCSLCYSQKIATTAVERDHSDIKMQKTTQKH
jgi:hypothetical protein